MNLFPTQPPTKKVNKSKKTCWPQEWKEKVAAKKAGSKFVGCMTENGFAQVF